MFGLKDKIASTGLKKVINGYLSGIGEVEKIDLDQKNKKIFVSLNLKGEDTAITVSIDRYELVRKDNALYFRINDASSSKEWVEASIKKFGSNLIPVPGEYSDIVENFL